MEHNNKLESGFLIKNLLLLESIFTRINDVVFDSDIQNDTNIDVKVNVNDNVVSVAETIILKQKNKDIEQVSIKVTMVGIFEKVGDAKINIEEFGHINGAAIIFPFIREHISSLSLKAGIGIILLPPVNFTKK